MVPSFSLKPDLPSCNSELQLNKANVLSDAEASFLDIHLSISDGF